MPLHVTDGHADLPAGQGEGVVPVTADVQPVVGGLIADGQPGARKTGQVRGQHVALQGHGELDTGTLRLGQLPHPGGQRPEPDQKVLAVVGLPSAEHRSLRRHDNPRIGPSRLQHAGPQGTTSVRTGPSPLCPEGTASASHRRRTRRIPAGPPHTTGNEQRLGEIEGIAPPLTSVRTGQARAARLAGRSSATPGTRCLPDLTARHRAAPRKPGMTTNHTLVPRARSVLRRSSSPAGAAVGLLGALPGTPAGLSGAAQHTSGRGCRAGTSATRRARASLRRGGTPR